MNIKVEINGVDTSKLPRLSQEEQKQILYRIKNGETQLKEKFIEANLRLVLSIVKKFNNRGENVDDVFQIGVVGLIKAIDNFDIKQDVQFSTYAVPMIIGEIKRYLRDNNAFRVARSIRDLSYLISKEREKYIQENNEEPTIEKICELVQREREDVIMAIESLNHPMSFNDVIYNDGGDCILLMDKIKDETNEAEKMTDKLATNQILQKLSEKERYIIERRFFAEKTQIELAEELGVSQAQISRIEKGALDRMRRKMYK